MRWAPILVVQKPKLRPWSWVGSMILDINLVRPQRKNSRLVFTFCKLAQCACFRLFDMEHKPSATPHTVSSSK